MSSHGMLDFSLVAMVDDVIQQHGKRLSDIDLASRKANEACMFFMLPSFLDSLSTLICYYCLSTYKI